MSKQSKIESYAELETALVNFYNEALPLFRAVPPEANFGGFRPVPEAIISKPYNDPKKSVAFFTIKGIKNIRNVMSVATKKSETNLPVYVSEIFVNTNSIYFDDFLKNLKGFELILLHEMLHIVDTRHIDYQYEFDHTRDFNYIKACHLIAKAYPLTPEGKEALMWTIGDTNLWVWVDEIKKREVHGIRFMILCYYLAKNLLTKKGILKKVLHGREVEGSNTWQKREWLAIEIYRNNLEEVFYQCCRYYENKERKVKDEVT